MLVLSCCQGLIMGRGNKQKTKLYPSDEDETNCAHFATGGVSECRHREGVLLNSVCSPVVHCVRPQSGSAICVMFSSH